MKGKNLIIVGLVTMLAVVALVVVKGKMRPERPKFEGPVEHLSIGVVGDTSLLILLAKEWGLFEENGLEVEIERYTFGAQGLGEVLAGRSDVAVGADYVGTLNSFDNGDFRIVASIAKTNAYEIVARADNGLNIPADVRGKRIGVTRGTAGDYWLGVFLRSNRLTEEDVEIVDLRPPEIIQALIDGEIDAGLNLEPYTSNVKDELAGKTVSWYGERGQGIYSLVYVAAEVIETKPEAVERMIRAIVEAEESFKGERAKGWEFMQSYFEYDNAYMEQVVKPKYIFGVNLAEDLVLSMEDEARWMLARGMTSQTVVPNYLNLIYFEALDVVKPEAVSIIH